MFGGDVAQSEEDGVALREGQVWVAEFVGFVALHELVVFGADFEGFH